MLEEPKIKKVDKRDKQLPQNFEQLMEMYDIEKIWPYMKKVIDYINNDLDKVAVSHTEPTGEADVWIQKGKNLLPSININRTISGITFRHNEDGSITMNGTATNKVVYPINVNGTTATNTIKLEENSNYILSGNNSSISGLYLQGWYTKNGSNVYTLDAIETTEETNLGVYIAINSGVTVTNITIFPQVEQGSTATEYEEYTERKINVGNSEFLNAETMGIETITNENGTAIKYPDGSMICSTMVNDGEINFDTATGGSYRPSNANLNNKSWTFPVAFIDIPTVIFVPSSSGYMIGSLGGATSTYTITRVLSTTKASFEVKRHITAIGRWK